MHPEQLIRYLSVLLLFSKISIQAKPLPGMAYYIYCNAKNNCDNTFPYGLSYFFEQVGGYGDKAEVEQVSAILKIDLSLFQDVDSDPVDFSYPRQLIKKWKNIDSVTSLIDTFLARIALKPNYYKSVIHNTDIAKQNADYSRIMSIPDTAVRRKQMTALEQRPGYYYPPDHRYLSDGRIVTDLKFLKQILLCFKRSGATKVRLEYD